MFVLKHNGRIYGADLTKAELTALQKECDKYIDKCLVEEYKKRGIDEVLKIYFLHILIIIRITLKYLGLCCSKV